MPSFSILNAFVGSLLVLLFSPKKRVFSWNTAINLTLFVLLDNSFTALYTFDSCEKCYVVKHPLLIHFNIIQSGSERKRQKVFDRKFTRLCWMAKMNCMKTSQLNFIKISSKLKKNATKWLVHYAVEYCSHKRHHGDE